MVAIKVGSPVRGEDFFDREREQRRLWQHLATDHVLLLAPRRVGKTSLMLKLADDAAAKGFLASYVTVESMTDEVGFVARLLDAAEMLDGAKPLVQKLQTSALGGLLERVRKLGPVELRDPTKEPWDKLGEEIARVLLDLARSQKRKMLLLVDEVPVFILQLLKLDPTGGRARSFLHWFRELRQNPQLSPDVRWLVAGSIGLDNVARRMGLSRTINDFYVFDDLGAFQEEKARELVSAWSQTFNLPLDEPTTARLLERVGWLIPYHLQLLFSAIMDERGEKEPVSASLVDAVYERLIGRGHYFDHWAERLREELLGPDDKQAMALLSAAARPPEGAALSTLEATLERHIQDADQRDEQLGYLLGVLKSDGYLVEVDEKYRFRSPMLRDFWVRRFGSGKSKGAPTKKGS